MEEPGESCRRNINNRARQMALLCIFCSALLVYLSQDDVLRDESILPRNLNISFILSKDSHELKQLEKN